MNEKLVEAQNAQIEVKKFQDLCDTLNKQITTEAYRIDLVHAPLIQKAINNLDTAKQYESEKYSEYIVLENKISDIKSQIDYFQTLHDMHPYSIQAVMDLVNISNLNMDLNAIIGDHQNAWLKYLDSQTLREKEERDYNSALLAKQTDSKYLDQLKRELIAATNSLNTWKIAYQAAMNVYNGLAGKPTVVEAAPEPAPALTYDPNFTTRYRE